jgi:hypothetical protein
MIFAVSFNEKEKLPLIKPSQEGLIVFGRSKTTSLVCECFRKLFNEYDKRELKAVFHQFTY